jgi:hypothetical protein
MKLYYRSGVVRLKERLTLLRGRLEAQNEEWPELIEGDER